ncbi:MAG: S41 family peptidase, partial [Solirubrobacteraceae bacterium]
SLDDQFSNYFSPEDYADFQEVTQGQFSGVGMTVEETDKGLRVMTVYDGSPADKGGLKPGDIVTAVNGRSIAGDPSEASTAKIKGPAGTSVTLTVKSEKAERDVKLERAQVDIPVVESSMERRGTRKVGHVRLAGFTSGAHGEVSEAVRKLLRQGADGIVLDLRDNGGGLLNEAVLVSSIFIPEGKIVSTKGRSRPERTYDATGGSIPTSVPVAVLVNRQSASASEIVTGALQDRKRATVVGTRTFGKGVFQEIEPLDNGGALDITVGEYFTPSGRNLGGGGTKRGAGLQPNVVVRERAGSRDDRALAAALALLARAKRGE